MKKFVYIYIFLHKKIVKEVLMLIIFVNFCSCANSQQLEVFHGVYLPDSVAQFLETLYPNQNVSARVHNLIFSSNKKWIDGIYAFSGQGPHYPRHLLISKGEKFFVFESEGFCNPKGVLKDFCICINQLHLSNEEIILYLKEVYTYLEYEYGLDYGITIK